MIYSEADLFSLQNEIKSRLSSSRFTHTIGVVKMTEKLNRIFSEIDSSELKAAALLHDVTKELDYNEHISLCKSCGIKLSEEDCSSKEVLHSLSAEAVIKRDFPKFASPKIINAVKYHTLASADMTVFSKIVFISDYIEEGRTHDSCITAREMLLSSLSIEKSIEENENALNFAIIYSIDKTAEHLLSQGKTIHSKTLAAKKSIESKLLH